MAEEFSVRVSVKVECLQEEQVSIKEEVCVKEEIEWEPEENSALAELYGGHNVTDEIVLGPETLQTPEYVAVATRSLSHTSDREVLDTGKGAQHEQISELKTCVVKLKYDVNELHNCHLCQKTFKDNLSHIIHMKTHVAKDIHLKINKPKYAEKKGQSSSSHTQFSNYFVTEAKRNVNDEKTIFMKENNFTATYSTKSEKADIKKNRKSKLKSGGLSENDNHVVKVANQFVSNINDEMKEKIHSLANVKRNRKQKWKSEKHSENEDDVAKLANHYDLDINNIIEETNSQANTKKNKKLKLKSRKQFENDDQAAKLANGYDLNINNQIKDKSSSHEALTNTCNICDKSFSSKVNLTRHSKLHTGQKPHKCKMCKKQFARIDYLRTHERIHSKQKVYSCEYCYKEFTDSSNYNKHRRFHRDVKRFTCEFCGKQFGQAIHLSTHQLTHTGEKPYHCKICKKQFTYKHRLKAHERLHIGRKPYGCQLCSKRFIAQCRLSRHEILIHKMILSFICALCEKQFKRKAEIINHISNSH